jgi:hypothetical protein
VATSIARRRPKRRQGIGGPGYQLASGSATPDVANQYPHDGNYDQEYETGEGNEYTYRIFHRKFAAHGVEAIKTTDGRGHREHIIFRHLEGVFVRMILRFPGK